MRNNAGVFQKMNAVVYYSNTGQSKAIAEYFAHQLSFPLADVEQLSNVCYKNLVLVFPVHCQNVPPVVEKFLKKLQVQNLALVATYGKMYHGNVLWEIQRKSIFNIVAGAYVPTKHAYLQQDETFDNFDKLHCVVEKIKNPSTICFPKLRKNSFANFIPKLRSQLGVKLRKNARCNGCGHCTEQCKLHAIDRGVTNNKCIRCLKCAHTCPQNALDYTLSLPLKLYLRKQKTTQLVIYV